MSSEIKFTSEISVDEIQQIGSDEMIAHAAMVSTKGYCSIETVSSSKIEGLINFLIEKRHGSPFEHGSLTVRVHAPIKVWREWHRHRVGWSYNEESGRYKDLESLFYLPPRERLMIRDEGFKSSNPVFRAATYDEYTVTIEAMKEGYIASYNQYKKLLDRKVDRGLARDILGVGIYSSCYCTANPRSIMHFLELRTDNPEAKRPSKPLYEIAVAAQKLEKIFAEHWPLTYYLWNKHGRVCP